MLVIVLAVCLLVYLHMCGGNIPSVMIFCLIQKYNHIIHLENTLSFFVNHFHLLIHLCYSFIEL